jgi:dihydroorotase
MNLLAPVDIGAALRDPGAEEDETRADLAASGARGGFAAICPRPATTPLPTTGQLVESQRAAEGARLIPAGVLTTGGELAEIGEMVEAGARVIWDLPGTRDNALLRAALEYAGGLKERPLIAFDARDPGLGVGVWSEGEVSTRLGLAPLPEAAEVLQVQRVIELGRLTGARVHLQSLTSARAVAHVRAARGDGVAVTASVDVAHLIIDERALLERPYDPALRVWPPPRTEADRDALLEAVRDGTCILSSGHSPRAHHKQDHEFSRARPGHATLEKALGVALGVLGQDQVEAAFCRRPRALLGLDDDARVDLEPLDAWVEGGPLSGAKLAARVI